MLTTKIEFGLLRSQLEWWNNGFWNNGLDKVKFPILTIGPQNGCLFWYLATGQHWFFLFIIRC